jgi:hypothetical protein
LYEGYDNLEPLAEINLSNLSDVTDSTTAYNLDIAPSPNIAIDTALAVHLSSKNHVGDVTFTLALAFDDPDFLAMYNNNKQMYEIWNDEDLYDALDEDGQAAVDDYVDGHPELTFMPDSLYSIPSFKVTIPNAGVLNVGRMPISFRTGAVDADGNNLFVINNFVLPIKIQDAAGYKIASNFSKIFLVVAPKNEYDGTYHYTTSAVTSLRPNSNATVKLITAGLNRLHFNLLNFYSNDVWYNVDPNTNQVTVECPTLGVQTPQDTRSVYDPATRTFHIYWKQGNGGRTFEETFEYLGPR